MWELISDKILFSLSCSLKCDIEMVVCLDMVMPSTFSNVTMTHLLLFKVYKQYSSFNINIPKEAF